MIAATQVKSLSRQEEELLDSLIAEYQGRPGMLLSILERIQNLQPHRYLPMTHLEYLVRRTGIAASSLYGVVTFYALFNLSPQGEHSICICRGTACHTRGSRRLLEAVRLKLGIVDDTDRCCADNRSGNEISATTVDNRFTVRTVACFGQCALAPVVEVNHQILSHVNERALSQEIEALRNAGHEGD
ncbi:MAG: NAD(P)H-dependent oxidoreductase subunit E [Polyangiaceae bacterium]